MKRKINIRKIVDEYLKQDIKRKKLLEQEKKGEIYQKFKNIFSDGKLLEVKKED